MFQPTRGHPCMLCDPTCYFHMGMSDGVESERHGGSEAVGQAWVELAPLVRYYSVILYSSIICELINPPVVQGEFFYASVERNNKVRYFV